MNIEELRKRIDIIDADIMKLYVERMGIAAEIGAYKREHGLPAEDMGREQEVIISRTGAVPDELKKGAGALMRSLMISSKIVQRRGGNLYLIGMSGSGKTRLGKRLAAILDMPLMDTDKLIMARTGMTIDAIFDTYGEEHFRKLESEVLKSVARDGGTVVAAGGGMPLYGENGRIIKNSGLTVFLNRRLERLLLQKTVNRPLIRGDGAPQSVRENIIRLYNERRPLYEALADITVDPDAPGTIGCIKLRFKKIRG